MDEASEYRFGNAAERPGERQLLVGGTPRPIGARAFDLLLTLIERRDRVVRKNELLDCVWPGMVVEENNLQVHISSLRKLLGPHAIATVPGRGYRFTARLEDADHQAANDSSATPRRALGNLPPQRPHLYGRACELEQLRRIAAEHRLVTLAGAGGIGKSVLALALAHELAPDLPGGVWLVELAPLADASLVVPATAAALRIQLQEGVSAEDLAQQVAERRLLLVLDNCEHLPHAAAELAMALVRYAPDVRVLATSREPLKLAEEHVFRIGGLAVPHDGRPSVRAAGSVALFEARAQAVDATFSIRDDELDEAVAICRHLDGIPLAIEFAAARIGMFGVRGLRAQLEDRFRVLTRGARLAQPRHQTLHAALEWSFALLDEGQQRVLRSLAVFAGGFNLESAAGVCAVLCAGSGVLDQVGDLVDKSLVVAESGVEPRYRLLETTRAFAWGKLAEAGQVEFARRAHANAMLERFRKSSDEQFAVPLAQRIAKYAPDLDNLRAALDWASGANGNRALFIELTALSTWIWHDAGGRPEGMRRVRMAFDRIDDRTPADVEARLCLEWMPLASPATGEEELARARRAVDLGRKIGDEQLLFQALALLGRLHAHRYEHDAARVASDEALGMLRGDWPPLLRARFFLTRSCVWFSAQCYAESLDASMQARRLADECSDELIRMSSLIGQEQCCAALGRWRECVERGRELQALIESAPGLHQGFDVIIAGNLSMALIGVGDIDAALEQAREARVFAERTGSTLCLLDMFAALAFHRGFEADAARIVGCADARLASEGQHRELVERMLHENLVEQLRDELGPAQFARLAAEGAAMSVESVAALALREDATQPGEAECSAPAGPPAARQMLRARA
jgi:predicted ATPase/DNA-binding winged helix-turn-helix (wHTH) protein